MSVENIFAPEQIQGERETEEYIGQVLGWLNGQGLRQQHAHTFIYSKALRQACAATLEGARGVGSVATCLNEDMTGHNFVAEGKNRLNDDEFDWSHVAHAEVLTIAQMNRKNKRRRKNEEAPIDPHEVTIWSTLGPCPMCMIACINRRVGNVVTIAPDWTGGVTMDHIADTYPGFAKHIREHKLQSFDAPVDLVPRPETAQKIRTLCWAVSRISMHRFSADEFYKNQDLLTHDALSEEKVSINDLTARLKAAVDRNGLDGNNFFVRHILDLIEGYFGSLRGSKPILHPFSISMTPEELTERIALEGQVLIILNLIKQIETLPESARAQN
ncbi:hypothetical protein COU78_02135 [Candidatus Peregrinibacteria bacterium CG10_big_fil_rev_8_21_14_0_10_49_24]|nr:MAG: hypothetical protein COV83_03735 [Candidatus Peregrinibacteria bacterium CG11_big_fil_rev_8_21_14_0_20_49_14]PIR51276.1 MAG: hypothetical protein COU78_02135 [Candidatus Peregrinibacteria bacterium CG10_big_fil_rev_8_21_14_0_10_49_24]PJA68084.1 MAG: hypothetical protein CO157_00900 [Candidatus Peregrinibacteria bacterium CG_4_9_14_3_um_filter_49_12]